MGPYLSLQDSTGRLQEILYRSTKQCAEHQKSDRLTGEAKKGPESDTHHGSSQQSWGWLPAQAGAFTGPSSILTNTSCRKVWQLQTPPVPMLYLSSVHRQQHQWEHGPRGYPWGDAGASSHWLWAGLFSLGAGPGTKQIASVLQCWEGRDHTVTQFSL